MNLNRYSPHYDHDGQCVRMSIDESGAWIHITTVREIMRKLAAAEQQLAAARAKDAAPVACCCPTAGHNEFCPRHGARGTT